MCNSLSLSWWSHGMLPIDYLSNCRSSSCIPEGTRGAWCVARGVLPWTSDPGSRTVPVCSAQLPYAPISRLIHSSVSIRWMRRPILSVN